MKALVLTERESPLVFRDEPDPVAAEGEVVVELRAAALNRRDFWITQGMYPGVEAPCVLGSDGAGLIGDREVVINPGIGWGDDESAQSPEFSILGMPRNGTFAERVAVPAELVHDKPAHLSWDEAAALPLAGVTAYRALFAQGGLEAGQTVLISGAGGGVAAFALQFAVAAGANAVVTSSSAEKLAKAKELGAAAGFNYREESWAKGLEPVDLILDSAAGPGYNALIGLLKPGGRIVNYGATAGAPKRLDFFKVFWNQLKILGSTMGSPADFDAMLKFVGKHQIRPEIDRVVPLSEGSELVASMADSPQFGKLVLAVG